MTQYANMYSDAHVHVLPSFSAILFVCHVHAHIHDFFWVITPNKTPGLIFGSAAVNPKGVLFWGFTPSPLYVFISIPAGVLPPEELFYLRSRGLTEQQAREALVFSFGCEVLDKLPWPDVTERVAHRLRERLAAAAAAP